jgi:hypothetical protein
MTKLAKSVTLLIADVAAGQREFLTVAVLRDTLLSKIGSGGPWVKDAERFIGECT